MFVLLQLVVSMGFTAMLWKSRMIPAKYLLIVLVLLLIVCGIIYALQHVSDKNDKISVTGVALSILISIILGIGILYFAKADKVLGDVGGATYKTDNMIVVVKKDDPAEAIEAAKDYRFGYQTAADQDNNALMIEDIESRVGRELMLVENATVVDMAQALLDGRIDAAIYNEAYSGIIEETIENYQDQVRVLYQYGIQTEIEQEETNVEEAFNIYISGIDVAGLQ